MAGTYPQIYPQDYPQDLWIFFARLTTVKRYGALTENYENHQGYTGPVSDTAKTDP